jgi:hypothetical protein
MRQNGRHGSHCPRPVPDAPVTFRLPKLTVLSVDCRSMADPLPPNGGRARTLQSACFLALTVENVLRSGQVGVDGLRPGSHLNLVHHTFGDARIEIAPVVQVGEKLRAR